MGLFDAILGEVDIGPASELVGEVPLGLAMTNQD